MFKTVAHLLLLAVTTSPWNAAAQSTQQESIGPARPVVTSPDAMPFQNSLSSLPPQITPGSALADDLFNSRSQKDKPLSLDDKFTLYTHRTFGPSAVVLPVFGATFRMIAPISSYPPSWRDGPDGFARLYGVSLATHTARLTGEFLVNAALHEDPRYCRSSSPHVPIRIAHALAFIFVQKSDGGATVPAFSHAAAAASGGFLGMAYLPSGYDDVTHATQRTEREFGVIAASNLAQEFAPALVPVLHKLHINGLLPGWWVSDHRAQP